MTETPEPTDIERNWLALRNELDRTRAERDSWEAQFHSAAAAASEYSGFWEKHQRDFDQFGNYIPHSQIDGDLRAAKREIARLMTLYKAESAEVQRLNAEADRIVNAHPIAQGLLRTQEIMSRTPAAQASNPPIDITGWKLVPDQPTEEMWQAGRNADIHPGDSYSKVWSAMFDAAPNVDDSETALPKTQRKEP